MASTTTLIEDAVPRVAGIASERFRTEHMLPGKPVIVSNVDGLHPEWNLDYFRAEYGAKAVPLDASFLDTAGPLRMMRLHEYLDLLEVNEAYVRGVERLFEIIEKAGGKDNLYYPDVVYEGNEDDTTGGTSGTPSVGGTKGEGDEGGMTASPGEGVASDQTGAIQQDLELEALRDEFWQLYDTCNELKTQLPPGKFPYVRNLHLTAWFPLLADALQTPPPFMQPNYLCQPPPELVEKGLFPRDIQPGWQRWTELFIGGRGVGFPYLHYDTCLTHAWSLVLHGAKTFYLIDPQYSDRLYTGYRGTKEISHILGDIEKVDLQQFPLFEGVPVHKVTVKAGELVYIPPGWWHTAKIESICITMAGNYVNDINLDRFNQEYAVFSQDGKGTSVLTAKAVREAMVHTC